MVGRGDDAALDPFFMIDAAERLGGVRIFEPNLGRLDLARAFDILRVWQVGQAEKSGGRPEDVELSRRIIDQRSRVTGNEGVALATAKDRAGEVVNVGEIVPVVQLPGRRLIFDIDVELIATLDLDEGRYGEAGAELAELQRVGDVEIISERRHLIVARDNRVVCVEAHTLERIVHAARSDQLAERDL